MLLGDRYQGGTRCPQRVGETDAALLPVICAFGESFAIVFGEADPPISSKTRNYPTLHISAAITSMSKQAPL